MSDVCIWSEDGEDGPWATKCGHYFAITDGTPKENEMAFCCFCGKELVQCPHAEDDDAAD